MARASKKDPPAIQQLTGLRAQILQLAVQGKLVPQDAADEPASVLQERIAAEREQLIKSKQIKKPKPLPPIDPDDVPYELPRGWEWARLGDCGWLRDSERIPVRRADRADRQGAYPYYGAAGIIDTIDDYLFDGSYLLIGEDGKHLKSRTSPRAFMARGKFWVNNHAHVLDSVQEDVLEFLAAAVEAKDISPWVTGSDQYKLTAAALGRISVPIPPLAEQQRIVAKVDELMAAIDELEAYLRRVEALRPQILQLAVQGKLVPQNASDEPSSVLLERIAAEREQLVKSKQIKKPKPLPPIGPDEVPFELPQGWEWARIRDVSRDCGQAVPTEPFTYIDVSSIDRQSGQVASADVLAPDDAPSRARKKVEPGSVLYSTVRPLLGNITLVRELPDPAPIASTAFAVVQPLGRMDAAFLFLVLKSEMTGAYVAARMKGASYPAINDTDFSGLIVPVPPIAEQKRIVAKVHELTTTIDVVQGRVRGGADMSSQIGELVPA